jgi:hypothetical protein
MKDEEDDEFERIERESGWRKRQTQEPRWKEWVGLTDEEIEQVYMDTMNFQKMARALETKLKERNT